MTTIFVNWFFIIFDQPLGLYLVILLLSIVKAVDTVTHALGALDSVWLPLALWLNLMAYGKVLLLLHLLFCSHIGEILFLIPLLMIVVTPSVFAYGPR